MKKVLDKIRLWLSYVAQSFKSDKRHKWIRVAKIILVVLIFIFGLLELTFGITIYGLKNEDSATKFVARIVPFPAVISSSGVVTMADYYHEKDYITKFYQQTNQDTVDQSALSKQIIDQLIENRVIASEAIKYKITVSDKEVDDAMQTIYDKNQGVDEVSKVLENLYGLTLPQFKELVRTQLLRDKMSNQVIAKVVVRHILIKADASATPDQDAAAKAKITDLYNQIKAGADFADLANKNSEDTGSNQNGGLLDPFARGDMVKEFEDMAFSTPVGELSAPFKSSFGWHIIKVEKRTGMIDKSFDDWISGLKSKLLILNLYKG